MTADLALGWLLGAASCALVPAVLLGLAVAWAWRQGEARRGRTA